MSACVFCNIVGGKAPVSRVLENASTLAFLDIQPVSPGHLLVIPKAHFAYIWEMPPNEVREVFHCLPYLAQALKKVLAADAVDLLSLNGEVGGQSVYHVHFHLIPMYRGHQMFERGQGEIHFRFHQEHPPRDHLDALAGCLREALQDRV